MGREEKEYGTGMCYRCDWRARYLEEGTAPRTECRDIESTKFSCYMYRPCLPPTLAKAHADDPRSELDAPIFAARSRVASTLLRTEIHGMLDDKGNHIRFHFPVGYNYVSSWRTFISDGIKKRWQKFLRRGEQFAEYYYWQFDLFILNTIGTICEGPKWNPDDDEEAWYIHDIWMEEPDENDGYR